MQRLGLFLLVTFAFPLADDSCGLLSSLGYCDANVDRKVAGAALDSIGGFFFFYW